MAEKQKGATGQKKSSRRASRDSSDKSAAAFRTISEVANFLTVEQHVLRFWETKFIQIKPLKRAGGRRYYRPEDVNLLRGIQHLLYEQGYTIKGVRKVLRESGPKFVLNMGQRLNQGDQQAPELPSGDPGKQIKPPPVLSGQAKKVMALQQGQMDFGGLTSGQRSTLNQVLMELESLRDYLRQAAAV